MDFLKQDILTKNKMFFVNVILDFRQFFTVAYIYNIACTLVKFHLLEYKQLLQDFDMLQLTIVFHLLIFFFHLSISFSVRDISCTKKISSG